MNVPITFVWQGITAFVPDFLAKYFPSQSPDSSSWIVLFTLAAAGVVLSRIDWGFYWRRVRKIKMFEKNIDESGPASRIHSSGDTLSSPLKDVGTTDADMTKSAEMLDRKNCEHNGVEAQPTPPSLPTTERPMSSNIDRLRISEKISESLISGPKVPGQKKSKRKKHVSLDSKTVSKLNMPNEGLMENPGKKHSKSFLSRKPSNASLDTLSSNGETDIHGLSAQKRSLSFRNLALKIKNVLSVQPGQRNIKVGASNIVHTNLDRPTVLANRSRQNRRPRRTVSQAAKSLASINDLGLAPIRQSEDIRSVPSLDELEGMSVATFDSIAVKVPGSISDRVSEALALEEENEDADDRRYSFAGENDVSEPGMQATEIDDLKVEVLAPTYSIAYSTENRYSHETEETAIDEDFEGVGYEAEQIAAGGDETIVDVDDVACEAGLNVEGAEVTADHLETIVKDAAEMIEDVNETSDEAKPITEVTQVTTEGADDLTEDSEETIYDTEETSGEEISGSFEKSPNDDQKTATMPNELQL